jgi:hypothetical protein
MRIARPPAKVVPVPVATVPKVVPVPVVPGPKVMPVPKGIPVPVKRGPAMMPSYNTFQPKYLELDQKLWFNLFQYLLH